MTSSNFQLEKENHLQIYPRNPIEFARGEGVYLYDADGKSYLDFLSGIAVNALGHSHPRVMKAIQEQLSKYIHLSNLAQVPSQSQLAASLCRASGFDKVFFCNSGTEANEAVIKFVRKYWHLEGRQEKQKIISMKSSFHGRTCGALALTGQPKLQANFGRLVPDMISVDLNDVEALKSVCDENIAAIIIEPILAEGGILTPSPEYIHALHQMREQFGVILVADEIQTGCGRLGTFLGSHQVGLCPDMVSMAKPIGGGLPLGAVLLNEAQAKSILPGDHGTTFGGNPVACAAGLAVVQEVQKEGFLEHVRCMSDLMKSQLNQLVHDYDVFLEVRGEGLLLGLETTLDTAQVISTCQLKGLIIARAGANVLRFLPPLIVNEEQINEFFEKFKSTIAQLI